MATYSPFNSTFYWVEYALGVECYFGFTHNGTGYYNVSFNNSFHYNASHSWYEERVTKQRLITLCFNAIDIKQD